MNSLRRHAAWSFVGLGAVMLTAFTHAGPMETNTAPSSIPTPARPPAPPPLTLLRSPVERFRQLLAMKPAARELSLSNYPVAVKARILEKVQEYELLPPDYRELRLQVTELRWYLLPLLKTPATNRPAQLREIPEPYRKLVTDRLQEWDIMPPPLKDEVLDYETTMHYFVGRGCVVRPQMTIDSLSEKERSELEHKLAQWQELPLTQRQQIYGSFQHFFELSDQDKEKTLQVLSTPERQQTEKIIGPIEKWPRHRQQKYVTALREFATMSPEARQQFMQGAERWQKMSPEERQAWHDLVQKLSEMPPLPPGLPIARPAAVATNGY